MPNTLSQQTLSTIDAIEQRRSVKHFDPNFTMPQQDMDRLMQLALLSPTSFNIQNWRFVLVKDPELRKQVQEAAWNQVQVTEASLVIVLCADLWASKNDPNRYWQNAPAAVQEMLVPMIGQFYNDHPDLQRDEAHRSCGIAAQTIMLAAKAMGYDSCPMVGFDSQKLAELIQLPEHHLISLMVVVGKALEPARPRGGQLPQSEVVLDNHF